MEHRRIAEGVIYSPTPLHLLDFPALHPEGSLRTRPSVFLGGSIEMGKATDWQTPTAQRFVTAGFVVFNPRRLDWNSEWEQSKDNPNFAEQVRWEWEALAISTARLFYFEPKTLSPISLLEFGKFCDDSSTHVVCPEGFWRKGNVDVVCSLESAEQNASLDEAIDRIVYRFGGHAG